MTLNGKQSYLKKDRSNTSLHCPETTPYDPNFKMSPQTMNLSLKHFMLHILETVANSDC